MGKKSACLNLKSPVTRKLNMLLSSWKALYILGCHATKNYSDLVPRRCRYKLEKRRDSAREKKTEKIKQKAYKN